MTNHQIVFDAILGITTIIIFSQTHGLFTVPIDETGVERVAKHRWSATKRKGQTYFTATIKNKAVYLHRYITNAPSGTVVDHRNPDDTLDHRRANLRICSQQENTQNQRPRRGSSRFKGVSWHKRSNKWQVQIKVHGKRKSLGLYAVELDAAHAYDAAATEHYGNFAYTNFPPDTRCYAAT